MIKPTDHDGYTGLEHRRLSRWAAGDSSRFILHEDQPPASAASLAASAESAVCAGGGAGLREAQGGPFAFDAVVTCWRSGS